MTGPEQPIEDIANGLQIRWHYDQHADIADQAIKVRTEHDEAYFKIFISKVLHTIRSKNLKDLTMYEFEFWLGNFQEFLNTGRGRSSVRCWLESLLGE